MSIDLIWMERAIKDATHSNDPSTKVGCIVVKKGDEHSFGWNSFPRGVKETPERVNNRELKYKMVVHAEINAILNKNVKESTVYVTHPPCSSCMGAMIQAGVKRVVTRKPEPQFESRWKESIEISQIMAQEAGVIYDFL